MPAGQGFIDTNESSLATAYSPGWPGGGSAYDVPRPR